jgi:hypothetical protein
VLLVAADVPYPEPLHHLRPLPHPAGVALLLAPARTHGRAPRVGLAYAARETDTAPTRCTDAALDELRRSVPAARALPLLEALARGERRHIVLDADAGAMLTLGFDAEGS